MCDYFKPWRRKIGVVTLVVACVFAAGWVKSYSVWYTLAWRSADHDHFLRSYDGAIAWQSKSPPYTGSMNWWDWTTRETSLFWDLWVSDGFDVVRSNYQLLGFMYRSSSSTVDQAITIDGIDHRFEECTVGVPYWSIDIPLTVLSAWLLLSKPRPKSAPMPKSVVESSPEVAS